MTTPQHPELIFLDLDGTSVIYEPHLALAPGLADLLADLGVRRGVRWCMNSDRLSRTQIHLAQQLPADMRPAAICSIQRYIHWKTPDGAYLPDERVNSEADRIHATLWKTLQHHFESWMEGIHRRFPVHEHVADEFMLAIQTTADAVPELRRHLTDLLEPWPEAFISGNIAWVFVVHREFSKGRVLSIVAERLGVPKERVLAVGDGFNDIPMLDGTRAGLCGCPANAEDGVKAAVAAAGGIISAAEGPHGTIDIIRRLCGM